MQFSSLALPPHPFALALIPDTPAMEEKEPLTDVGRRAVALVQARHAVNRGGQQFVVTSEAFARPVHPVGQQCETQVPIRICQIVDLQPLHLLFDFMLSGEQRGDELGRALATGDLDQARAMAHESADGLRALDGELRAEELQPWQDPRSDQIRDYAIDECNCQV